MAAKCLVFAYGLLKPGHAPPRSLSHHWNDRIPGRLYDLGSYPAAVDVGHSPHWIEGVTMEIDDDELAALDEFEDVESGEYRRVLVTTEQGFTAWVYEFAATLPPALPLLSRWP
jgi:gamma-glutamylcyclotransferase (GGCT)/AIG2-like uncharacterized protein YtfP